MSADFFEASKSSRTTVKRQCVKPLAEWHDLNAGLLLCAFQIEHELQRFFGPEFPRIVVERASDGAVGSLHFNQPLHSPVSCDEQWRKTACSTPSLSTAGESYLCYTPLPCEAGVRGLQINNMR